MLYSIISSHSAINVYQWSAPNGRGIMKKNEVIPKGAKEIVSHHHIYLFIS